VEAERHAHQHGCQETDADNAAAGGSARGAATAGACQQGPLLWSVHFKDQAAVAAVALGSRSAVPRRRGVRRRRRCQQQRLLRVRAVDAGPQVADAWPPCLVLLLLLLVMLGQRASLAAVVIY
jgi:hypothetical protein